MTKTGSSSLQREPKRLTLTFRVEGCAERSNSRTYACERLCERRLQRRDNLPHKTTTRKMLMCLNCWQVYITHTLYLLVHSPTSVHITLALYNTLANINDVEINKHFEFRISLNWFLLPVRSVYVIPNLMVQLPALEMFTVKNLGVSLAYTRAMLLRCICTCRSSLSYCRYATDFGQPYRGQGGHCRT